MVTYINRGIQILFRICMQNVQTQDDKVDFYTKKMH